MCLVSGDLSSCHVGILTLKIPFRRQNGTVARSLEPKSHREEG